MGHTASVRGAQAAGRWSVGVLAVSSLLFAGPASAADSLKGQVLGGGAPIANSTVTLWAASAGAPKQLARGRTGTDGRFALNATGAPGKDAVLYLVAKGGQPAAAKVSGDNPAIALMALLGTSCRRRSRSTSSPPWPRRSPPRDSSTGNRSRAVPSGSELPPGTFRTWWIRRRAKGGR